MERRRPPGARCREGDPVPARASSSAVRLFRAPEARPSPTRLVPRGGRSFGRLLEVGNVYNAGGGSCGSATSRSVTHPTRLETRTKESCSRASLKVLREAQRRSESVDRDPSCDSRGAQRPPVPRSGNGARARGQGPDRW
ncbi:hypothetical protein TNCT_678181 [Trichonephila clavata]|uniref:Uncharacterized protein n=1 Tax=Trichonephila clavata TaxID=2740835 RepID=A0A8X6FUB9_TRICU|nr:hypothetical protein TNCT_678181 [Trichonephila clavata]